MGPDKAQEEGLTEFANSLCATRNSLVHAKVNYKKTGAEVAEADLPEYLPAVEHASLMAVRWFFEQPSHIRMVENANLND